MKEKGTHHPFDVVLQLKEGQETGSFKPGGFEAMYETLFAEMLSVGGVITSEERARLDHAAAALGLDPERVVRLEAALLAAWDATQTMLPAEDLRTLADRTRPMLNDEEDEDGADLDTGTFSTGPPTVTQMLKEHPAQEEVPTITKEVQTDDAATRKRSFRVEEKMVNTQRLDPQTLQVQVPAIARDEFPTVRKPPPSSPSVTPMPPIVTKARPQTAAVPTMQSPVSPAQTPVQSPAHPIPAVALATPQATVPLQPPNVVRAKAPSAPPLDETARMESADLAQEQTRVENMQLRARYQQAEKWGRVDEQWCAAAVLVRRGVAQDDEREFFERLRRPTPIRPARALTSEVWPRLLFHPDEDSRVGLIFSVIASGALVGRVSAMRRDGTLPRLLAAQLQDPSLSTVSAVRAVAWASATLGMRAPPIYLSPEVDCSLEIVTAVPPVTRIGAKSLAGKSSTELAFHCGRHIGWYREEHFVCTLVPTVRYLEDMFFAALLLGSAELRLQDDARARAEVIAGAVHPCLEPHMLERLEFLVNGFLASGGRVNLKRWARAAEWTTCRAGLLLCGDLSVATGIIASESKGAERVRQLELFWASDQASELRRTLGVALDKNL